MAAKSPRSSRESVRMPIRTLLRDQDQRVDRRVEAAMNRMTEAIKDFKMELKELKAELKMEFREFKAELKVEVEKSTDEKLRNLFLNLVMSITGVIVVLVPSSVAGFELLGGRILFPGNR